MPVQMLTDEAINMLCGVQEVRGDGLLSRTGMISPGTNRSRERRPTVHNRWTVFTPGTRRECQRYLIINVWCTLVLLTPARGRGRENSRPLLSGDTSNLRCNLVLLSLAGRGGNATPDRTGVSWSPWHQRVKGDMLQYTVWDRCNLTPWHQQVVGNMLHCTGQMLPGLPGTITPQRIAISWSLLAPAGRASRLTRETELRIYTYTDTTFTHE